MTDFRSRFPDDMARIFSVLSSVLVVVLLACFLTATAYASGDDDDDDDDDDYHHGHDVVIITDLDDLNLGTWTGAAELSDKSVHCVAASDKKYSITATGDGIGGAFQISSGIAEIPFQVYYRVKKNADQIQLQPGTPVHNLKGKKIKKKSPYCKGGKMVVEVRMLGVDMAKVPAGPYSGSLNLMVTPE